RSATTSGQQSGTALYQRQYRDGMTRFAFAADRNFGALEMGLAASWLAEDRTVLGARFHDSFGKGGADSVFLDAIAAWPFASGWRLGAAWRQGFTRARPGGLIAGGSRLVSNAWSFDVSRSAVFAARDSLALRLAQPLRVQSGGLNFDLPDTYSYDTLTATNGISTVNLSPGGREIDGEIVWHGFLWGGAASASLFYRHNPGHFARLADDKGVAMSWKTGF
ncbi:MAG: peptidase S8, partial [Novosphingobium sp.]